MELLDVRRTFNMRVKIFGVDKSDISFSIKLWIIFYLSSVFFSAFIYENEVLLFTALFSFIPVIIIVKFLKIRKNLGHLEYLQFKLLNLRECKKNKNYSPYNLNNNNYIYKTKLFIRKPSE